MQQSFSTEETLLKRPEMMALCSSAIISPLRRHHISFTLSRKTATGEITLKTILIVKIFQTIIRLINR